MTKLLAPPKTAFQTSIHRLQKPSMLAASDRIGLAKHGKPTRANPLIISASELRDFLRCRVRHNWRHHMRLMPKGGSENLAIGIVVHQLLEAWYTLPFPERTTKAMEKLAKKFFKGTTPKELTLEHCQLIQAMLVGFAEWVKPHDAEVGLKVCTPEQWFALPLTDDHSIIVRGKIDNVFEPTRMFKQTMACNEYKTKGQIRVDMVELNLQISVYLWALRELFPNKKRYLARYTILRKQLPGPRVKADLFHVETVERQDEEIQQWVEDTRRIALDMLDAAIYPNPMDACSFDCDFKMPCLLRGRPGDLKHVLKTEYQVKERTQ